MPDLSNRRQHEREIEAAMLVLLRKQNIHLVNDPGDPPWAAWEQETAGALVQPLAGTYGAAFGKLGKQNGLDVNSDEIKGLAMIWALLYSATVAREIVGSTRQATQDALRRVATEGIAREEALAPTFDRPRIDRIGITETTRAVTAGEREAAQRIRQAEIDRRATGVDDEGRIGERPTFDPLLTAIWFTEQDGLVCPICRPLDRTPEDEWPSPIDGPPAHPRCRCWVEWELQKA